MPEASSSIGARRLAMLAQVDGVRFAAITCERTLEHQMSLIKATRVEFRQPVACGKWGMRLHSVEQRWTPQEDQGVEFLVSIGEGTAFSIDGCDAPGFLYRAALVALEGPCSSAEMTAATEWRAVTI